MRKMDQMKCRLSVDVPHTIHSHSIEIERKKKTKKMNALSNKRILLFSVSLPLFLYVCVCVERHSFKPRSVCSGFFPIEFQSKAYNEK